MDEDADTARPREVTERKSHRDGEQAAATLVGRGCNHGAGGRVALRGLQPSAIVVDRGYRSWRLRDPDRHRSRRLRGGLGFSDGPLRQRPRGAR